jgi:hypothetical protein
LQVTAVFTHLRTCKVIENGEAERVLAALPSDYEEGF